MWLKGTYVYQLLLQSNNFNKIIKVHNIKTVKNDLQELNVTNTGIIIEQELREGEK